MCGVRFLRLRLCPVTFSCLLHCREGKKLVTLEILFFLLLTSGSIKLAQKCMCVQLKSGCVTHACLAPESVSLCIFAYLQLIMHTEPLFARASVSIAAGELRFRRIQGHVCFIFESNTLVSCDGALAENGHC